jgi:hypothetical protein
MCFRSQILTAGITMARPTLMQLANLRVAQEEINFQRDNFGKKIEIILQGIQTYVESNPNITHAGLEKDTEFVKLLKDLIFDRLGLQIDFRATGSSQDFATIVPFALHPHPLNNWWVDPKELDEGEYLAAKQRTESLYDKKGTIDLTRAKVGGVFSTVVFPVYFDLVAIFKHKILLVPELVAILLHELGHIFTYLEYSDRLEATNQVMAELAHVVKDNKDPKQREYLIKEIGENLKLSPEQTEAILTSTTRQVLGYRLFEATVGAIRSQMPNAIYNQTSSEQLADNFAARFGYGREAIVALEKIMESYKPGLFLWILYSIYRIWSFGRTILMIMAAPYLMLPVIVTIYVVAMLLNLVFAGTANRDWTYDDLKIRYKRIRDQTVELINQLDLPPDELKKLIGDLQAMDDIIKKTERVKGIYDKIKDFLFAKHRNAANEMAIQELLEELVHNDLFVKSAEFKLLSA